MLIQRCLIIGVAGFFGALARFALSAGVEKLVLPTDGHRTAFGAFPWGTLVVNAVACFAIGLLWSLAEGRVQLSTQTRAFIFVGFLGSFSTFSTYALESLRLMQDERWVWAFGNILAHNVFGLLFVFAGFALARNL